MLLRVYRALLYSFFLVLAALSFSGQLTLTGAWTPAATLEAVLAGVFLGFLMRQRVRTRWGSYNIGNVTLLSTVFLFDLHHFLLTAIIANAVDFLYDLVGLWQKEPSSRPDAGAADGSAAAPTRREAVCRLLSNQSVTLIANALGGAVGFWLWHLQVPLGEPFYLSKHGLWFLVPAMLSDALAIALINLDIALERHEPVSLVFTRDLSADLFSVYITVAIDALVLLLYSHEGLIALLPLGAVIAVAWLVFHLQGHLRAREEDLVRAEERAHTDELTQLRNVRYFRTALEQLMAERRPFALFMIDLNKFKEVNDRFGHQVGDEALRRTGAILRSYTREGDIPCRYGGDEFAVLLPDVRPEVALQIGRRIVSAGRSERVLTGCPETPEIPILLSVGISFSDEAAEASEIIRLADDRLYRAKVDPSHVVTKP